MSSRNIPGLVSATEILKAELPDIEWVIHGLMPIGLSLLAGAPKVGKSWLSLQMAKAVSSGESILDHEVTKGSVLYLALEDSKRRLQKRMEKQGWPEGLEVEFMTLPEFLQLIKDLHGEGSEKLAQIIEKGKFKLVIIDTLSRAMYIDQNDVRDVTACLSPLQATAQRFNCAILIVDHHRKLSFTESPDAITDVLGSTAKGGVADTIMGIYKKRGSAKAQFSVTGRDIDETTIDVVWEKESGCWILPNGKLSPQMEEILDALEACGPITNKDLSIRINRSPGPLLKQLNQLKDRGLVIQNGDKSWEISNNQE